MKGRFDRMASKSKERDRHIQTFVRQVEEQKNLIKELTKVVKVDTAIQPMDLGLPYKTIEALEAGLKNPEIPKELLVVAAGLKKDNEFMRSVHSRLLDISLVQRLYASSRE